MESRSEIFLSIFFAQPENSWCPWWYQNPDIWLLIRPGGKYGDSWDSPRITFHMKSQVSVVMWFVPRPPVRESQVRIPSQHGNLVKFILVWAFFNPSVILTQPYPAFLLSASRPFNRWPSVWFGSLSPLTAKWQVTSAAEPNLRVTSTHLGWVSNDGNPSHPPTSSLLS